MADENQREGGAGGAFKLMNFVSEEQLEEARKNRGARVEDGTAQRDRSLYEILKENKDKKDAEFNERFKHRPPKALDEDETEFLDNLEMSSREYERQVADEEARELRSFQAAVAAQSIIVHELEETPPVPKVQDKKLVGTKNPLPRPYAMVVKVKSQAKKAKLNGASSEEPLHAVDTHKDVTGGSISTTMSSFETKEPQSYVETTDTDNAKSLLVSNSILVSYSDESEED